MKICGFHPTAAAIMGFASVFVVAAVVSICALAAGGAPERGNPQLIQPAELVKLLSGKKKPLIIQVGFRTLYEQAHIPGSEYVGPASQPEGWQQLHKRVQGLSRKQLIVLYCGCCPWSHCPNVRPAFKELTDLGFENVRVLYIANNFGTDWVDKGYPVSKGR